MSSSLKGPLSAFAVGIYDGPHATPKEANDGPVFLGIKNVTPEGRLDLSDVRHIRAADFPKWTRRVTPRKDDIVFSYEATLHRYALIPEGFIGCLGRRMALVRPDPRRVHPRFLHYYFLSPIWRAKVEATVITGATVDRIPLTKFPHLEVELPTLARQEKILAVLSTYDDLIETNRRRIELLEQSARLLYEEWFVRLRFPGHEHVPVVDGVPSGWRDSTLGEHVVLNYGKSLTAEDRTEGEYPVYGSSGIVGSHDKPLVNGPGIVVGRKGNVGSVFWSPYAFWPIDTAYYVSPETSTYYLLHSLRQMRFSNSDGAVPGLNRKSAYSRRYLVPDSRVRNLFEELVAPMYQQVALLKTTIDRLRQARDLLLPRLMSGEISL